MIQSKNESTSIIGCRRFVVLITVVTVLSLGLPLFMVTTTVYRAVLPVNEINELERSLTSHLKFESKLYVDVDESLENIIPETQQLIDNRLKEHSRELSKIWSLLLVKQDEPADSSKDYVVQIRRTTSKEEKESEFKVSQLSREIVIFTKDSKEENLSERVARILLDFIFGEEISQLSKLLENRQRSARKDIVMPFSSTYNIVISLLIENGKTIEWEIEDALTQFLPFLQTLRHISNFTVSTQTQNYCQLTESPIEDDNAYLLETSQLTTFVNHGDWNLVNHDINPTINFVVFFPRSNFEGKRFNVENSRTNSFMIPQWGGVVVLNKEHTLSSKDIVLKTDDLYPLMRIFVSHLFQLLGVPNEPKSLSIKVDILSRVTILKNLKTSLDNLKSLVKLTDSLSEISVPELTKGHVHQTLDSIRESLEQVNLSKLDLAVEESSKALRNSNKAFFEKEMVQQSYFPSEHKLAVYLPLLGPMCSILTLGTLKLFKEVKSESKLKSG